MFVEIKKETKLIR